MKVLWEILACIGFFVLIGFALFGVMNLTDKPQADITLCEKGKCQQFNVRERTERR